MKGIYKFTNLINQKSYIGQSINLENRYNSHRRNYVNTNLYSYNSKFYRALRKYGFDNFKYEILISDDNFTAEELNTLEQKYVAEFDTYGSNGYNMNPGGNQTGSNYFISYENVLKIKQELKNSNKSLLDITKKFKLSSESIVSQINNGKTYSFVGDFTYPIRSKIEINKIYQGGNNGNAIFTDDEVMKIREEFVNTDLGTLYQRYEDRISFSALKKIVYGVHYTHLPIYKKREKKWTLNGTCIDYPREGE